MKVLDSTLTYNLNINAEIFHCQDCGICRLGKREDYIHCNECNLCINKKIYDQHPCVVNMKDQDCPICLKSIWNTQNEPVHILDCGHSMHTRCFYQTIESQNFFCPLCKKSITDLTNYWKLIDTMMSTQEMPEEYQNWTSDIHCNDCEKKSNTKYHFTYHKCQHCQGYNTVIDKVNKHSSTSDE